MTPAGYLDNRVLISDDARQARDRLLRKITADNDLPALGSSVARVVELASSDDDSVRELAHFLLSDVALTQKVLRLSNTVCYRTASGVPVTTISRAIFLLGFDTVKTSALAMLLVDGLKGRHGQSVRTELNFALSASVIGREMARRSPFKDAEEAAVAALFKNMGRLLVAAHDHDLYADIAQLTEGGNLTQAQASMQVLGCSFDMLAESVLQEWQIPDTIIHALAPLPQGVLKPTKARQEWVQQVAAFSTAAATLIPRMTEPGADAASRALLARFGAALNLNAAKLTELLTTVAQEARALTQNADLLFGELAEALSDDTQGAHETRADEELPLELLLLTGFVEGADDARHPSGKPLHARDLLMAGVQDVTEMMATGRCKVNDLIMLALETLYRSMGFRFATVCLRDVKTGQFRARIALGDNNAALQRGFVFAAGGKRDLFALAMENNADLVIADATSPKIALLIPAWHKALLPQTRSFIILPLIVHGIPFGFFYADRVCTAPEGVPPDETALIKTLKGQVLAALNSR
ncbi:MAG: HDOD domain-containing protein [Herminiimonas sp.]|nr:HDOD domain-containing protein [Herminiimonas sp.]